MSAALLLILLSEFWKYNATYFSTYRESGACRIRLAEKLRRLPLSFFGKKDLADLTDTIMGDVQVTEQMFSHYVPQFYGAILSTCLVAVSLLCYDWQTLTVSGLWIQSPDKEYTPIFTGDFVFDFGLSFQSQTIDLDAAGLTWHDELLDYTNTIQSLSLSPLSLTYRVDCSLPRNDSVGPFFGDIKIVLKDGTVFFSESQDYDAMRHYIQTRPVTLPITGEPWGAFRNYIPFDQPLDLSQVDYVQYGNNRIPVNAG